MARRYSEPISVQTRDGEDGQPAAFTWRGATYHVRVIGTWRLSTRWWEIGATVDRVYFRVQTADQQVFELYRERDDGAHGTQGTQGERWTLDVCLD